MRSCPRPLRPQLRVHRPVPPRPARSYGRFGRQQPSGIGQDSPRAGEVFKLFARACADASRRPMSRSARLRAVVVNRNAARARANLALLYRVQAGAGRGGDAPGSQSGGGEAAPDPKS